MLVFVLFYIVIMTVISKSVPVFCWVTFEGTLRLFCVCVISLDYY